MILPEPTRISVAEGERPVVLGCDRQAGDLYGYRGDRSDAMHNWELNSSKQRQNHEYFYPF